MIKMRDILNESITKSQVRQLKSGDEIWITYSKSNVEKVRFLEFLPGSGTRKDLIKVQFLPGSTNAPPRGFDYFPLNVVSLEDPGIEPLGSSKKGFLSKGVHGPRKWK